VSVEIRPAQRSDAEGVRDFLQETIVAETGFVISLPEELILSPEQQSLWIDDYEQDPNALLLVAELEGQIIGVLDFKTKKRKRLSHTGEFGISVRPGFQDQNIGQKMLAHFIDWAKENPRIEKVDLCVFGSNKRAIHVYEKLGFTFEGRQKKAVRLSDGLYEDLIYMALEVI
jgi:RimJ/RimL family protein N-acetyltransferase